MMTTGEITSVPHTWNRVNSVAGTAIRFAVVGVVNTLLDATVYLLLTRGGAPFFETHIVVAKLVSFLVATVSSFLLNRRWTFGITDRITLRDAGRFYLFAPISLLVNVGTMGILVRAGMYDLIALAVTTIFTFAVSFTVSKLWIFTKATRSEPRIKRTYAAS